MKQSLQFQTEVTQLLQLMIHSLYSNKEIFLRELISNSADAIDKLRFQALAKPNILNKDEELKIVITAQTEAGTITISDNGIGMTEQEIIEHLGTIAKSGTKSFLEQLSGDQKKDAHLIGQFGVGFYSSFIVADHVTVESRSAYALENEAVRWSSEANGSFEVENIVKKTRGTDVTLHLKEDAKEFLSDWTLRRIVNTYSDHIAVPIYMRKAPEYQEDGSVKPSEEMEVVNQAKALWTRSKTEISDEQYQQFYRHLSHDGADALAWTHYHVEGKQEYTGLLYIPKEKPFDLYDRESQHGVKLYVKRVFIMDDAKKLLPNYLRFVRGIIDSHDLPLNVSRELLQENKALDSIRVGSIKKVLDLLEQMAKNESTQYQSFWQIFGPIFKEGLIEDPSNKEKIARLCRFASTLDTSTTQSVSLDDYIARMPKQQKHIYYLAAENYEAAKNSPHLEIFIKRKIEVLLLTDRVDEWAMGALNSYQEKTLSNIAKGELKLDQGSDEQQINQEQKEKQKEKDSCLDPKLIELLKDTLKGKISDVRPTHRLTESPACLVVGENELSPHLRRMLEENGSPLGQFSSNKPVLEINSQHPLVKRLMAEQNSDKLKDLAEIIFEETLLAEGGKLENPALFVKKINQLIINH